MRGRLFWTILAGFGLTLAFSTIVTSLSFTLLRPSADALKARDGLARERAAAVAVAWRYGGRAAVRTLVASWPERARDGVVIDPEGRAPPVVRNERPPGPPGPPPSGPQLPIILQLMAGLGFSAALATYLVRPIGRLRRGFRRLAEGDLDVRLSPAMGGRRDELAGLTADFDVMAERLQNLILSRDRLLHDVSHELRSPLARMQVAVGLARQTPAQCGEALARIEAESERLNAIVGDLLSLFRAEERCSIDAGYIDVEALLAQICADAGFEARPLGVTVSFARPVADEGAASHPLVLGDSELLRRAIENVVRNALRFSHTGGVVEVTQQSARASLIIEVRDHGPGVEPALRPVMFDPFVKGAGRGASVGLGLSIARRGVAAHGGEIEALSPADGGLCVRIRLPVARDAPADT